MSVHDLMDAAAELLVAGAACLDAAAADDAASADPVGLAGAPERAYVSVAEPAYDCPQLTVHVDPAREAAIGSAEEGARGLAPHALTVVELVLTLVRCVPVQAEDGSAPSAAALNGSALGLYAEGWVLWCGVKNRIRRGDLFASDGCRLRWLGALSPVAPQGGVAGWRLPVIVQVEVDTSLGLEAGS